MVEQPSDMTAFNKQSELFRVQADNRLTGKLTDLRTG